MTEIKDALINFSGALLGAIIPAGFAYWTWSQSFKADEALLVSTQQPFMSSNVYRNYDNYLRTCNDLARKIRSRNVDENSVSDINRSYYNLRSEVEALQLFIYRFKEKVCGGNFQTINKLSDELTEFHRKILSFYSDGTLDYGIYFQMRNEMKNKISKFVDATRNSALSILQY